MKRLVFWQLFVAALLLTSNSHAQSIKDLFNKENIEKAVNAVTGKSTADMTGTWSYTGSAIEFESDNLLQKAGGAVAATAAEKKLDEQLAKVGIKAGQMSFTFNADSTFSAKVGQKSMKGSYSYNASTQKVNLKFAKLIGMNAKVNATSTTMDLLFESDKLLKLITFLSSKSSNSTLKSIGSLANRSVGHFSHLGVDCTERGSLLVTGALRCDFKQLKSLWIFSSVGEGPFDTSF